MYYIANMKHTKIVATVSDKRCDKEFIAKLAAAGVNVVRLNSAHLNDAGIELITTNVREAAPHLALMIDTKGPEIRTTVTENETPIEFVDGDYIDFVGDPTRATTHTVISLNYADAPKYLKEGDRVLIDDGELAFRVLSNNGDTVTAVAENCGVLGSRKSINIPGVCIPLPSVTERDKACITKAASLGIDFVAHSFVRSAADVKAVQEILDSLGSNMKIISKIENQEGVDNFDEILDACYGIMVARGDLGIEVAIETLPGIQQKMINKCIAAHKPVIVATQMLQSMIEHPRPTRAEVSDVANAVYQRADAMMLSGETANGKYPVEAVQIMSRVALEVEKEMKSNHHVPPIPDTEVASFLARQAVVSERVVDIKAIITDAYHGATARYLASYRATSPVFAICYNQCVARWLALSYGVESSLHSEQRVSPREIPVNAMKSLISSGKVDADKLVAYLSGTAIAATSLQIDTPANLIS